MFSWFNSERRSARTNARDWLDLADRVFKFRRDQLTETQRRTLAAATQDLARKLAEDAAPAAVTRSIDALEPVLRDAGGRIYPPRTVVEYVEFFLVAAIVILGLRAYFVQPFKIPTNSMWPSYYGMTPEVFTAETEPGWLKQAARLALEGATHYRIVAPADGEVLIPVPAGMTTPAASQKTGRSLLIFPALLREITLSVDGHPVRYEVPADFDLESDVLKEAFFPEYPGNFSGAILTAERRAASVETSTLLLEDGDGRREVRVRWVPTGRKVRKGETIFSFDILTGDLLFVDRLSYNFVAPQPGSGFVFRTDGIPALEKDEGGKYFVKRLAGVPGDVLEIREPVLFRNGRPADASPAYGKNARREGKYPGFANLPFYQTEGYLRAGETVTVPPRSYFALGDNSPRSKDSRYWGFVPEMNVVGRPLFIYYPITSRWGPAH